MRTSVVSLTSTGVLALGILACSGLTGPSQPTEPTPAADSAPVAATPTDEPAVEPEPAAEPTPALYGLRGVDIACAPCVTPEPADIVALRASSVLEGDEARYGPANALDGDSATAWCEGAEGPGVGEILTLQLARPFELVGVWVRGGYFKSEATLAENARVKRLAITFDDLTDERLLADPIEPVPDPSLGGAQVPDDEWFGVARGHPPFLEHPSREAADELTVEIRAAWPGSRYEDLCISELGVELVDPEDL